MNKKQIIYTAKKTLATEVKGIKSLSKTFNTEFLDKHANPLIFYFSKIYKFLIKCQI